MSKKCKPRKKPVCAECDFARAEYPDPRHPPLEEGGEVLCADCRRNALETVAYEAMEIYTDAMKEIGKLGG